jgi:hypothetical protein
MDEGERVYEIDPRKKYAVTCDEPLSPTEIEYISRAWKRFIEDEKPGALLILGPGIKLVIIEPAEAVNCE